MKLYKIIFENPNFREQTFSDSFGEWKIGDIIDYIATNNLKITELPTKELAEISFQTSSEEQFDEVPGSEEFVSRANKSDITKPVIAIKYSDGIFLADGNHRLWKAYHLGLKTIKGYIMDEDELHKNIPQI